MKKALTLVGLLSFAIAMAQSQTKDTLKAKEIEAVTVIARKPTVESKADRTVFNVANSSILAGNTSWDIVRMTPLVSIDNNDNVKAEGESVTVYINDRKSVFTGKELKEYLRSIPADNLIKVEVITSPSSRYDTTGAVINIVLKKREDEGIKGSVSLTNSQNTKNNQYGSLNLNYHKNSFTQTINASYRDYTNVSKAHNINTIYADNKLTDINTTETNRYQGPSFSSTSEVELNDKNNIGLVVEYYKNKNYSLSEAEGNIFTNEILQSSYVQDQKYWNNGNNLGTNAFYKYYDKEKNRILDINIGNNYNSNDKTNEFSPTGIRVLGYSQSRNYYLKADYTTPIGKSSGSLEAGFKTDFNNNVIPNQYLTLNNDSWINDNTKTNVFHYYDNINSVYANYNITLFKKLEARLGLRYEHIYYKVKQDVGSIEKDNSYGNLLPNLLLKYSFSDKYNLTFTYRRNIWRPWFSELNPFLMPENNGTYNRGNMDLAPNLSNRFNFKFAFLKKYFLSATYWYSNQDYWDTFLVEDNKTISMPINFVGKSQKYSLFANTNQTFLSNKLNVNVGIGFNYTDNSDFNTRNNLDAKNYFTNLEASSNISYTNLFNKNINISAWANVFTQNNGNTYGNKTNVFHSISATKIFPVNQMEVSLSLNNIFKRPGFDQTTYSPIGTFRTINRWDWYGVSLTFVKRFGNQKVKENTKTDVEKNAEGGK